MISVWYLDSILEFADMPDVTVELFYEGMKYDETLQSLSVGLCHVLEWLASDPYATSLGNISL